MSITSVGSQSSGPYGDLSLADRRVAEAGARVYQTFVNDVVNKDDTLRQLYDVVLKYRKGESSREDADAAGQKLGSIARQRGLQSEAVQAAGNSPSKLFEISSNVDGKYSYEESLAANGKFIELSTRASQQGGIAGGIALLEQLTPEQRTREEYGLIGVLESWRAAAILDQKIEARVRAGAYTYGDQDPKDGESRLILSLYKQIGADGTAAGYARSKVAVQAVNRYAEEGYSTNLFREFAALLKPYGRPFDPQGGQVRNPRDQVNLSAEALTRLAREAEVLKPG
jgi:hypothetical protein